MKAMPPATEPVARPVVKWFAIIAATLCLTVGPAWAQETGTSVPIQVQPLTPADLDGLSGPNVSVGSVEGLIRRNILDMRTLGEEVQKELGGAARDFTVEKLIEVLLWEEVGPFFLCKDIWDGAWIAKKQYDVRVLHDNALSLEKLLWEKDRSWKHRAYRRFEKDPLIEWFHGIKRGKTRSLRTACNGTPSPPPPVPPACDVFAVEARNLPAGSRGQQESLCSLQVCLARGGRYPTPQDNYASVCGGGHNYPPNTAVTTQPPAPFPFGGGHGFPPSVNALACRLAGQC